MHKGFDTALSEEVFSGVVLDFLEGGLPEDGELFFGGEVDFFCSVVFVVAGELPCVGLGKVFEGADVGFLDCGITFLRDFRVLEGFEDLFEEGAGGGAVSRDGEVHAVESRAEAVAEAGHGGGVGFLVEGFVDDVGEKAFEDGVFEGGLALRLEDVKSEGGFGALELGVLGIVEGEGGFVYQLGRVFLELVEGFWEVGIGLGEVEGRDFAGVLELFPFFAGEFFVGVFGAIVFFRFVGLDAFGGEDAEHVVGAEAGEEGLVGLGVGLLPEVAYAFGDFDGVEAEVVGQGGGAACAFAFVGVEFFEASHDGLFLEKLFRVAGFFEHLDVGEGVGNDVLVVFEAVGGEVDAYE